ncbi:hypothetical protein C2S51_019372 [Perilla frutescens var. frutescens]|nr:hypothetical protein C2S51_019372 [Perilla frutescens var. frutescens]
MKMKTTMREWGDLPEELLSSIASNLYGKDIQSFSLVCRSWNAAVAESPYRRSPCLMLYNKRKGLWQFHQHSSIFYMRLPELEKAHICCSKYGWLLMCRGDRDLFFFDPFNRRKIEIVDDESEKRSSLTSITFFNPPTSPKCFVVGFESYDENSVAIEILQRGIDGYRWERHDYSSEDLLFLETVSAPVLRRGVLYFVDMKANVATLDVSRSSWTVHTKCLPFRQLRNKIKHHFLFEIKGDEALYAVFLIHDVEMVNVFRLSEPNMEWELLTDLGDKMVYLTHASSFGDTAHFPTMANNIYFPRQEVFYIGGNWKDRGGYNVFLQTSLPPQLRHWGYLEGSYKEYPATGELIEVFGIAIFELNEESKVVKFEFFHDRGELLAGLIRAKPLDDQQALRHPLAGP